MVQVQREPSSQGEEEDEEQSVRVPLTRPFSEHSNLSQDGKTAKSGKQLISWSRADSGKFGKNRSAEEKATKKRLLCERSQHSQLESILMTPMNERTVTVAVRRLRVLCRRGISAMT